jgi:hypothetical protein
MLGLPFWPADGPEVEIIARWCPEESCPEDVRSISPAGGRRCPFFHGGFSIQPAPARMVTQQSRRGFGEPGRVEMLA